MQDEQVYRVDSRGIAADGEEHQQLVLQKVGEVQR